MGISEYEPRVINQLLEFTYRYVTCILDDARVYANHSNHQNKKSIDLKDEKLAVQMIAERAFTTPLPRETLIEMARSKNSTPLPLVKPHCGLRLPPDRYCLSSCNFKLRTNVLNTKKAKSEARNINKGASKNSNLLHASIKRQPGQTTLPTTTKMQTVSVPKPVFKFSANQPQQPKNKQPIKVEVSSENMNPGQVNTAKRKREDETDIVI
ncbi:transcription initiation factor TFIID subunit 9-like [Ctenocephalides felis]|nr:transcription initiation factor TFIID subunit 9-like [Ctenocephalides felis]